MNSGHAVRTIVKRVLDSVGLLTATRGVKRRMWLASEPVLRERTRTYRQRYPAFRRAYGEVLAPTFDVRPDAPTALVFGSGRPILEVKLVLVKSLQLAGFRPVVLLNDTWRALAPCYRLARVSGVHLRSEFESAVAENRESGSIADLDALLDRTHGGVRVGRLAMNSALRHARVGSIDANTPAGRASIARAITKSLSAVDEADRILARVKPALALFWDIEYSPSAELFEACVRDGVDVVALTGGQRANQLLLKRYHRGNLDEQVGSLSARSWSSVTHSCWTDTERADLAAECMTGYTTRDWYREAMTQSLTQFVSPAEVRARLQIDPGKPTAVIFSHILWDAPLLWSGPLFVTYERWLVETVRAACRNDRVNWIIKIHPANVGKRLYGGYSDDPAEVRVLREAIGPLPTHVRLLTAETDISTHSLLDVTDYCLTVRGTVGIEAASRGIPVITAGRARYSNKGFTIDSQSTGEYLQRLSRLQDIARLSAEQTDLAARYAHALFVRRPLTMTSATWEYVDGEEPTGRITLRDPAEWRSAPDVSALAAWFRSNDEDFFSRVH